MLIIHMLIKNILPKDLIRVSTDVLDWFKKANKNNIFIKFTINKPLTSNYFVVHKVIIDKKLAFVTLRDSEGKKNYTYYLIKNDNNETWHITNVQISNTR